MRLSDFIRANSEGIIAAWETFARALFPAGTDIADLRDHALEMLMVIANDLDAPQTKREGEEKSEGRSDADEVGADTPAQSHGSDRAVSGFTIQQMVSEYRAMRATVVRLWSESAPHFEATDVEDLIRFSEAIDQALAESTSRFSVNLERTRETFLAILGHDLRTPLGAVTTSAQFILEVDDIGIAKKMAGLIVSSGSRMNQMVDDLLDFTRGRLGSPMPIDRRELDLARVLQEAVQEVLAANPEAVIDLQREGELLGKFDGGRLSQVFSNLMDNAISYGSTETPVRVTARRQKDEIHIAVSNRGPVIPEGDLRRIFDPMTRARTVTGESDHLGLGLYIVLQIVNAHGGTVSVESTEAEGTTFEVMLPLR